MDEQGQEIKVFRLNERVWYAGATLADCIEQYKEDIGYNEAVNPGLDGLVDDPREVEPKEMSLLHCGSEIDLISRSFYEHLAHLIEHGQEFPCEFTKLRRL